MTTTQYNAMGWLTETIDAQGHTATTSYYVSGEEQASTDALGIISQPIYDSTNRGLEVIDEEGEGTSAFEETQSAYDANGQATGSADAAGIWTYDYLDPEGRVTLTVDNLGGKVRTLYDLAGEVTETIDAVGRPSFQTYNRVGEVTLTTDGLGHTATMAYDPAGRETSATDLLGRITTTLYNSLGEVTVTVDPTAPALLSYYPVTLTCCVVLLFLPLRPEEIIDPPLEVRSLIIQPVDCPREPDESFTEVPTVTRSLRSVPPEAVTPIPILALLPSRPVIG